MIGRGSGDPGKFYSLFNGPESYQSYGPGQADYITVPGPNQIGPLINIPLLMQEMGQPGASRGDIEGIFGKKPKPPEKMPPAGRATASLDNGVRTDAMEIRAKEGKTSKPSKKQDAPAQPTPSTAGAKGDLGAESANPFAQMMEAIMGMFNGSTPGAMGGGTTVNPGYTQQPTADDLSGTMATSDPFQDRANDETILAQMMEPMQPTMPVPARNPAAQMGAPAMRPPVPTPNPMLQATGAPGFIDGGNDLRSIGAMLQEMFGATGGPNSAPPPPVRNPLFSGGV